MKSKTPRTTVTTSRPAPNDLPMSPWLYLSKRGVCGVVLAHSVEEAWEKAKKRHSPEVLVSERGEAYMEAMSGKCVREKDADWEVERAQETLKKKGYQVRA